MSFSVDFFMFRTRLIMALVVLVKSSRFRFELGIVSGFRFFAIRGGCRRILVVGFHFVSFWYFVIGFFVIFLSRLDHSGLRIFVLIPLPLRCTLVRINAAKKQNIKYILENYKTTITSYNCRPYPPLKSRCVTIYLRIH